MHGNLLNNRAIGDIMERLNRDGMLKKPVDEQFSMMIE